MSKKKSLENSGIRTNPEEQNAESVPPTSGAAAHTHGPAESLGDLAQEVQSFLDRRQELAQKLNLEIEATERKLAELKKTVEMLFLNGEDDSSAEKDKTSRKPKKVAKSAKVNNGSNDTHSVNSSEQASTAKSENHSEVGTSDN